MWSADFRRGQNAHCRQQAESDGKIVVAAFLGQVGGRQVDRDALVRQCEADGVKRGAHAFAAFGDGFVGQTHDRDVVLVVAFGHVDLDVDFARVDADKGDSRDVRDGHAAARVFFSMAFQIRAAISVPSKRRISQMPVGEVTLISVR